MNSQSFQLSTSLAQHAILMMSVIELLTVICALMSVTVIQVSDTLLAVTVVSWPVCLYTYACYVCTVLFYAMAMYSPELAVTTEC